LRPAVLAVVCVLTFAGLQAGSGPASAETADQAKAAAAHAQADVQHLLQQVRAALADYRSALTRLGTDVSSGISADQMAQEAQQAADAAQLAQVQRVRALYMSGGQAGLIGSVMDSTGPSDLAERLGTLDRVLSAQTVQVRWAQESAAALRID